MEKGDLSALLYAPQLPASPQNVGRSGRAPKRKGTTFERDVVNIARAHGLEAERAYGSNGRSLGHHEQVDLVITVPGIGELTVQAKRRKHLPGYILPDTHRTDLVVLREDRGEAVVCITLKRFLELIT